MEFIVLIGNESDIEVGQDSNVKKEIFYSNSENKKALSSSKVTEPHEMVQMFNLILL